MKPYEALANAIIVQACDDYRNALNELSQDPLSIEAYRTKREVERFFRSNWFATLTDIDPKYLLEKLRKEIKGGN